MIISEISELGHAKERAIIINVSTKIVSTLALLSAIRFAGMPVLLIDCESTDGSFDHFRTLMKWHEFDLMSAPLKPHGLTLDWLFANIDAEKVLLVDSDLEILGPEIISILKSHIDAPDVFGSGFINGPGWLDDEVFANTELFGAMYHERPWMPLSFFVVDPVKNAVGNGISFLDKFAFNEFSRVPLFGRIRSRSRHLRKLLPRGPAWLRRTFHGLKPSVVYYDTGAAILEQLRYKDFMVFVGLPESIHSKYVNHLFGVTRSTLNPEDQHRGDSIENVNKYVRQRLTEVYSEPIDLSPQIAAERQRSYGQ